MKKKKIIITISSIALIALVGSIEFPPLQMMQHIRLKVANPEARAAKAASNGDYRLIAYMNVGLSIPEAERDNPRESVKVVLPFTSDLITSTGNMWVQEASWEYAEKYNSTIEALKNESETQ